jgi:hypothetical protein
MKPRKRAARLGRQVMGSPMGIELGSIPVDKVTNYRKTL